MKPASVLTLTLIFAPIPLLAQNFTAKMTDHATTCPVSLSAQHLSDGDFVKTGIAHPKGLGQALHLNVANSTQGLVIQANILLRGWITLPSECVSLSGLV
jgi:hypothetical protein